MRISRTQIVTAAIAALGILGTSTLSLAQEAKESRSELSLLGGAQALNQNDTAFPDHFVNIPLVAIATYRLTPNLAVEGDFSWMIPVSQTVDMSGTQVDRKSPDVLSYQAAIRAGWPLSGGWTPYIAAGGGAVTFLSNTDPDRLPQLTSSQTVPAINFGAGTTWNLSGPWGVRGDFREIVAFPSDTDEGLSTNGKGDPIWMERGTLGLVWQF